MTLLEQLTRLRQSSAGQASDMIAFAQKLIQTPSYSGEEGAVARLVEAEMKRLRYDDVWVDRAGSVIGRLRGASAQDSILFNAHIDHVSVGDEKEWPHGPFSGDIVDGELWGRGAVDLKGSVAAMVHGIGALKSAGIVPPHDVYVAGVVFEELGGVGTEVLLQHVHPTFCVIGEATASQLALGHRGAMGMFVEIKGKAAHASMVDIGVNPHYSMARLLLGLRGLSLASDPMLGSASVTPTLYSTDQTSGNVIPGRVRVFLDWRSVPGETMESIMAQVQALLDSSLEPGTTARIWPRDLHNKTYTGLAFTIAQAKAPVKTSPESALARQAHRALESGLQRPVERIVWRFCTDGSVCAAAGVPIVGFGPGDQQLAHTSQERVALDQLQEATTGNAALALSPLVRDSRP